MLDKQIKKCYNSDFIGDHMYTQLEIWKLLVNGNTLVDSNNIYYKFVNDKLCSSSNVDGEYTETVNTFSQTDFIEVYDPYKWRTVCSQSKPIACWAKNFAQETFKPIFLVGWKDDFYIDMNGIRWDEVVPMTGLDIVNLIWKDR